MMASLAETCELSSLVGNRGRVMVVKTPLIRPFTPVGRARLAESFKKTENSLTSSPRAFRISQSLAFFRFIYQNHGTKPKSAGDRPEKRTSLGRVKLDRGRGALGTPRDRQQHESASAGEARTAHTIAVPVPLSLSIHGARFKCQFRVLPFFLNVWVQTVLPQFARTSMPCGYATGSA
jgi:hypothetical protein